MRRPALLGAAALVLLGLSGPVAAVTGGPAAPVPTVLTWSDGPRDVPGGLRPPTTGLERGLADLQTGTTTVTGECTTPAPVTAAGWQQAFDDLNDRTWSGADQGASTRLPDGRVLWAFDDTFQGGEETDGSRSAGTTFVRNSLVLSDGGCLRGVTGPQGREVIPNAADGRWYWPFQAVVDGGRVFVSSVRVGKATAPDGTSTFVTSGTYLAELTVPAGGTPTYKGMFATPSSGTPDTTPQWGAALAQADGFTYVYATQKQSGAFGKALYVARVPAGKLTQLSAWRYWNGSAWVTGVKSARAIRGAVGGVSTALTVWRDRSGGWRALTKKDDYLGRSVVLLRGPSPTGPWTETTIADSPSYASPGETTYNALAHPQIPLLGGDLLWHVSRNSDDFAAHLRDADLYKPQFGQTPVR